MADPWMPYPDLTAMMEQARRENLWFWCAYQDLWFSPDELEAQWEQGKFRWGAVNWKLRSPHEHEAELQSEVQQKADEAQRFTERVRDAR